MTASIPGPVPTESGETSLPPEFYRLAVVLLTGVLAVVFDTTIVSVAVRALAGDLHTTVATIQWVTTGYLLALGVAVPLSGWLVDRLGGKRVWVLSLSIFLIGSLASSLAQNAPMLISSRLVQGIGGGLMLPVMQTLLVRAAGGRSLGKATSLIALPAMLGPILGPVIGGLIVENWSWRWVFWVNIPFCLAGLLLAWRLMPTETGNRTQRLDLIGLALLSPAIVALLYGLSQIGAVGGFGDGSVVVPLVIGIALLTSFVSYALRATAPLVDLRLFTVSSFASSTVLMFLSGFVLYGALLVMPLYFQDIRGQSPLHTGLLLAPQGIGILASRGLAGSLTDRIGSRWVVFVGLLLAAAGTVPFAHADTGTGTNQWLVMAALVVRGFGLGGVTLPLFATAYLGLDRTQIADASIITRAAQQIGGSFGSAVLVLVLANQLTHHPADHINAYQTTFWFTIAFTLAAILLALRLPTRTPAKATRLPAAKAAGASTR